VEIVNDFQVAVPIEDAWNALNDIERVAPCLPGAELVSLDGDVFTGTVKVKVGPITAQYKGQASFVERDEAAHRAVIKAEGKESRGQGNASALITAVLTEDAGATNVSVTTDLTISGKVAQFGRGVLVDVSTKLLQQFASSLEADLASAADEPDPVAADATTQGGVDAGAASAGSSGAHSSRSSVPAEPVDLLGAAALPIAKRVAPYALATIVGLWLLRRWVKRH